MINWLAKRRGRRMPVKCGLRLVPGMRADERLQGREVKKGKNRKC